MPNKSTVFLGYIQRIFVERVRYHFGTDGARSCSVLFQNRQELRIRAPISGSQMLSYCEDQIKSLSNHSLVLQTLRSEVRSKDCRHSVSHQLIASASEEAPHVPSLCHVSDLSGIGICCEAQWYREESLPAEQWPDCQGGGGRSQGVRCCEKVEVWMDERRWLLSIASVFLKVYILVHLFRN